MQTQCLTTIGIVFAIPGTAIPRDVPRKNMGRAKSLTASENQVVLALLAENKSEREIAERIGRSKMPFITSLLRYGPVKQETAAEENVW